MILLGSLSLFRFDDEQAVPLLETAVKKIKLLQNVAVAVLSNAAKAQKCYFVSPPGNIPLAQAGSLNHVLINQWDQIGLPRAIKPKNQKFDAFGDT